MFDCYSHIVILWGFEMLILRCMQCGGFAMENFPISNKLKVVVIR